MILLYKDVHYANRNAAIIFIRLSVCLSVCHRLALCLNAGQTSYISRHPVAQ